MEEIQYNIQKEGILMKKIILLLFLVLGMTMMAEKFTPGTQKKSEMLSEVEKFSWFSANSQKYFDEEIGKHNFRIIEENGKEYLIQWKPEVDVVFTCHSRRVKRFKTQPYPKEKISEGEKEGKLKKYTIYPDTRKNVYYVKDYTDLKGKKYDYLYFGFDDKLKKIVILDKNSDIIEILEDGE